MGVIGAHLAPIEKSTPKYLKPDLLRTLASSALPVVLVARLIAGWAEDVQAYANCRIGNLWLRWRELDGLAAAESSSASSWTSRFGGHHRLPLWRQLLQQV